MVPLGWALRGAGHEVAVACSPGQAAAVTAAGLSAVPVLGELDMTYMSRFANVCAAKAGGWTYPWPPLHPVTGAPVDVADFDLAAFAPRAKRLIATESEKGFAAALSLAESWRPDVIVHDRLSADGLLAAKVRGIPAVAHLWGPVGTDETAPGLYPLPIDYTGAFARHGAGQLDADALEYVIDPCPSPLAPPIRGTRLDARYVPYNGPGQDTGPSTQSRRMICLIWSNSMSATYGSGAYLIPTILEALGDVDVDVLLPAHRDDASLLRQGEPSPRVTVLEQTPLHLLLPRCAAVIHHGGAGCAMTALAAGLPQLALTFGAEQGAIGARLAAFGAARHVPGQEATADRVRAEVEGLLGDDSHAKAAASLADENQERPTPAALVKTLEELAS
jgi:UDP:flavonoid glycosyltransferase YjiC (YdhE family)